MSTPVSVIISAWNEEQNIVECLERLVKTIPHAEILVIHGGKDGTARKAEEYKAKTNNPNIKVIRNYGDSGKAHGVKLGISVASHDLMMQFDADLQFFPEDALKVLDPIIRGEADIVIGSRFMGGADKGGYKSLPIRDLGNLTVNGSISLFLGQKITDVTTGYKAWTRKAIWTAAFKDNRFVYEMEIVMRGILKGLRVKQVPVQYASRAGGISGHGAGLQEIISLGITGLKIIWYALLIRVGRW